MDVVTIGETMVLFVPSSDGPLRYSHQFTKTIGGAESNVAIALSRLGHQTGWISRVGNDEFGRYIEQFIRAEGVDTSHVKVDPMNPTAVFFKERRIAQDPKIYYYRKNSAASFISSEELDEAYISKAKFLHLTGITPALSDSCLETVYRGIEIAKKHNVKICFDPNIRLKLISKEDARKVLNDIAKHCDFVLPGLEEGQLLTGEKEPEQIATRFIENGSKTVVIKLEDKGAFYANSKEQGYVSGIPLKQIIDTSGAGDGFAAGFLSGLLRGWDLQRAVQLGNQVGAYACTVSGDIEGYPFFEDLGFNQGDHQILR